MNDYFQDIRERIAEEPTWYDENGTPRYGKFSPDLCPNIYASGVVLIEIACQSCGQRFAVEMHTDVFDGFRKEHPPKNWHYGDPPCHKCVGDSMNCEDLEVLQVWSKSNAFRKWKRVRKLEGKIDARW